MSFLESTYKSFRQYNKNPSLLYRINLQDRMGFTKLFKIFLNVYQAINNLWHSFIKKGLHCRCSLENSSVATASKISILFSIVFVSPSLRLKANCEKLNQFKFERKMNLNILTECQCHVNFSIFICYCYVPQLQKTMRTDHWKFISPWFSMTSTDLNVN